MKKIESLDTLLSDFVKQNSNNLPKPIALQATDAEIRRLARYGKPERNGSSSHKDKNGFVSSGAML